MHFETVDWLDPRAIALRTAMDIETSAMYADRQEAQSLEVTQAVMDALTVDPATITHTVIALDEGVPVAHAALRPFGDELEVKKVYVAPTARGRGYSSAIMLELEREAGERGIHSLILQTGDRQIAAMRLYERLGYERIEVFGLYGAIPASVCYRKMVA